MHVTHLHLSDFRSWPQVDLSLSSGITAIVGRNGQGKTNLVEAIDYLARLTSHRVATDAPLIRIGTEQALIRAVVMRDDREATLEVEINAGRANRARVNKAPLTRTRDIVGLLRSVVFAPDDLMLVKGDPAERRRFLDDVLVLRSPRIAAVRSDFDRALRQRNSLLKSLGGRRRGPLDEGAAITLETWDDHLVRFGAELVAARLELVHLLAPYVASAYRVVAGGASRATATASYVTALCDEVGEPLINPTAQADVEGSMRRALHARRQDELDRGVTLVGPHRDDLFLGLAAGSAVPMPVKGYASHGESWSMALALKLAAYDLLRHEGDDPILILDDVFAELDAERRAALAELVAPAEQVLVTAAVAEDIPARLAGVRLTVADGKVTA